MPFVQRISHLELDNAKKTEHAWKKKIFLSTFVYCIDYAIKCRELKYR